MMKYLEVTPESIRLRKKELDKAAREKAARKAKYSSSLKYSRLSSKVIMRAFLSVTVWSFVEERTFV